ncbi:MAG: filamentous hemagglutinin N-terminal domain-containing protein, partial [Acidobacteriota bacterium]
MKKQFASAVCGRSGRVRLPLRPLVAALVSLGLVSLSVQAGPQGAVVRAGDAQVLGNGTLTRVEQKSVRAVIDWRSFGIGAAEQVQFLQPSAQAAILNRVTGEQASVILGRMDANGQVLLINPYGIVFGHGAQVNVGSLIASTSNISNSNFMAGRLVFDHPGRPGAGIINAGAITAAEGGLVALVAPHVRNDGLIQARLGKAVLGAADTFTIDLYGDGLVNLALSDLHAGQLRDANGQPVANLVTHTGQIDTAGGQAVLITAATAKNVLDNLINMSGSIKADTAVQQGGRILLLGEGGRVDVSGSLSAQGPVGGRIEVLGGGVHLASGAKLEASGAQGGGVIHVGGAYQGTGDTYRALQTSVDPGAILRANATERGNGGEAIVWSDGRTAFSGAIEARGGAMGGDGGRMEVSGKGTLEFLGSADASALRGRAGSLLLDPAYLDIGLADAALIGRVLRTGTSTSLAADIDINVNAVIDGRGRYAGGGLTMTAGNNINVNDFIVTNNGAINLSATAGTVNIRAGKAVFAGASPISVRTGASLHTGPLVTSGALTLASAAGAVAMDAFIDGNAGAVSVSAGTDVNINQPVLNLSTGSALNVTAGNDINVNAQIDGRGAVAGGAVALTAARNVGVNDFIVTNNGAINITGTGGSVSVAAGKGLFAGTGPIAINAKGNITTGASGGGALTLASSAGAVAVNGLIESTTGAVNIAAATDVNVSQPILSLQSGNALTVSAGNDINVNAAVDGRGGVAGAAVTLTAGRNLSVNDFILTNNGVISLTATNGTASVAADKGLFSGSAPVSLQAAGNLATGAVSGGSLNASSSAGSVTLNGVIDSGTGRVDLSAGTDVNINQPVLNLSTG